MNFHFSMTQRSFFWHTQHTYNTFSPACKRKPQNTLKRPYFLAKVHLVFSFTLMEHTTPDLAPFVHISMMSHAHLSYTSSYHITWLHIVFYRITLPHLSTRIHFFIVLWIADFHTYTHCTLCMLLKRARVLYRYSLAYKVATKAVTAPGAKKSILKKSQHYTTLTLTDSHYITTLNQYTQSTRVFLLNVKGKLHRHHSFPHYNSSDFTTTQPHILQYCLTFRTAHFSAYSNIPPSFFVHSTI